MVYLVTTRLAKGIKEEKEEGREKSRNEEKRYHPPLQRALPIGNA
jgi:hypothetical protein